MPQLLVTFVLIGIGWFLLIRPQQKRMRAQRDLVAALQVGDRVITAGGIHGTITAVDDETVALEVAAGVVLTLARPAISRRLEPDGPNAADTPSHDAADIRSEEQVIDPADLSNPEDRS